MFEVADVLVPTSYDEAHTTLENAVCWGDGNHIGCNRINLLEDSVEEFSPDGPDDQLVIQELRVSKIGYDAQLILQGLRARHKRHSLASALPTCQNCPIKKWETDILLPWNERH